MCYWEGSVVTNVLTAWLLGVTVEIFLLISPRRLGGGPEHEDAEDKQDGQPHLQSERNLGKRPYQGDANNVIVRFSCVYVHVPFARMSDW